jgi:hypothetical protein
VFESYGECISNLTCHPSTYKELAMTDHDVHDFHAAHPYRTPRRADLGPGLGSLTIPYTGQTRMRLTITSGMSDARVRVDPDATDLIAIDCGEGSPPRLRVSASEVRLSWPITIGSWLRAALAGEDHDIDLVLHPAVEWTLLTRGGLSRFEADLTAGRLARLEIGGGVSDVRLDLPAPRAVVPVRVSGGASELGLRRPAATGVSLAVHGGISWLCLDDQRFDAIGGGAQLVTGIIGPNAPGYAVEISGGASGLLVAGR